MRKFRWNKFWNCLTIFSLKWWGNPFKTCFEIVLQCFCWSDEEIRLKQDLKLSDSIFVEVMKKSGSDVFWNCLTMFSLKRWRSSAETIIEIVLDFFLDAVIKFGWNKFWNCLTIFSLKWWRNPVKTCFENFLQRFCWSHEGIWLRQVLSWS